MHDLLRFHKPFLLFLFIHFTINLSCQTQESLLKAPIQLPDRTNTSQILLTEIGDFGIERKGRPGIPAHLHTGIDVRRPGNNYRHEPIFPIADGTVISKRTDGPYAQLILEHQSSEGPFWTLYEHIAEILVVVGQPVNPDTEIARFFNQEELNKHGWQFDHFHFEILKSPPIPIQPTSAHLQRYFRSRTLECYDYHQLKEHFHDPLIFLKQSR